MHQARCIDVRELCPPKSVEHFCNVGVVRDRGIENSQSLEIGDQLAKHARLLFAHTMKEPAVGFGDDEHRRCPARCRPAEERGRLVVPAVLATHQRDEDATVEKYGGAHGASRPYTTSSTDSLSSGDPSTLPAYAIQGFSLGSLATVSSRLRRQSSAREM